MLISLDTVPAAIIPTLRYGDVSRAIDWLATAFGFEKHLIVGDDDGGVAYAELRIGTSMIMVGPADGSAFDRLMKQPDQIGGAETQICYLYVEDLHAHRDRAVAAGAEIVLDIDAEERGYSCRDPEGHIWNFGSYNPWHTLETPERGRYHQRPTLLLASLLFIAPVAAALLFGSPEQVYADRETPSIGAADPKAAASMAGDRDARQELARMRAAKDASEQALRALEEQLALERSAHVTAERSLQEVEDQLAKERTVASIGQRQPRPTDELERERQARLAADQARLAAERTVSEIREQLQQARTAAATAERTSKELREQMAKQEAVRRSRFGARISHYRSRAAARARLRRLREANEPSIKPPTPTN